MRTVADVFDVLSGPSAVARLLGVGTSTASEMKRRASIPVEYWPGLTSEAKRLNIEWLTYEALVLMHAGSRRAASAQPANAAA